MPAPTTIRRRLRAGTGWLLTGAAVVVAVASGLLFALRFVTSDRLPWSTDTLAMATAFTDFALLGFAAAAVVALVALGLGRRRPQLVVAVISIAAVAATLVPLLPRWGGTSAPGSASTFTLLTLNSWKGGADPAELTRAAADVDIVVLTEATEPQLRALARTGLTDRLRYRIPARLPERGATGTVVLARYPISAERRLSDRLHLQNWACTVTLPGIGPVQLIAVHPTRPMVGESGWLPEQRTLLAALPTTGRRLIAGDFNAVSSHHTLRTLGHSGWTSAVDQAGAGWVPTYPANSSRVPPLIDIDHVYTAGLQAVDARSVSIRGTDHLGLRVVVADRPG